MPLPEFKFVVVRYPELGGLELPVLLPGCVSHDKARAIGEPVSAGYMRVTEGQVETYGQSISLNLTPRPIDARLIAMWCGAVLPPASALAI